MEFITSYFKNYFSHYTGVSTDCWKRIILTFINDTSGGISFFLCIYFVNILNINITVSGVIISCYGLGTAIGGIAAGKLSDHISPTIISIISLLIKGGAFLILINLTTTSLIMINLFFLGLTTYGFKTSNNVWILAQSKNQVPARLKLINIIYTASNLGIGLSAIIVSAFSRYGFKYIFLFSSLLLFLSSAYLVIEHQKPSLINNMRLTDHAPNSHIDGNKKTLSLMLICVFLVGLIIAQLSATYSLYLKNTFPAMGNQSFGILFVLNSLIIVFFQTPLVNNFGKSNQILTAGIGAFLFGVGMMLLNFSTIFAFAIFACIVYTIGEMLFISLAQLVIYQEGGAKKKGQSLGLFQMTFALSIIIGPTLGGLVYHHFGANILWYVSGFFGTCCLIICIFGRKLG